MQLFMADYEQVTTHPDEEEPDSVRKFIVCGGFDTAVENADEVCPKGYILMAIRMVTDDLVMVLAED